MSCSLHPVRFALVLAALVCSLEAREIFVMTTADPLPPAVPPPHSLREAVLSASPGDVIKFKGTLAILLQNDLSLGEGVTIEGPAQISSKIATGVNRADFEAIRIITTGVTLKNLTFRNVGVTVGRLKDEQHLDGFTVTGCTFTQAGYLGLEKVMNATVDNNRFELTDDRSGDTGAALSLTFTRDCSVTNNVFDNRHNAGGINANGDENLLVDNNKGNAGLFLSIGSGRITRNNLPERSIFVDSLTVPDPGAIDVEENECGALLTTGLNMIIRKNKLSGKLAVKKEGQIPGVFEDDEEVAFVAMSVTAQRSSGDQITSGPVLVEENETFGSDIGLIVSAHTGATLVTVHNNKIMNADFKGIVINQTTPITVTDNKVDRCGLKLFRGNSPAGLNLRSITTADVLVENNTITNCGKRSLGIAIGTGSPVVRDNTVQDGKGSGIFIFSRSTPVLKGNTVERMEQGGVVLQSDAIVSLDGPILRENGIAGIDVNSGATLTCTGATIENNKASGVIFRARSKGTLSGGTIRNNKGIGVKILRKAEADLRRVSFGGNSGIGIDLFPPGITPNLTLKLANGGIDFPEKLEYDDAENKIRGEAEAGSLVQLYKCEQGARAGKRRNGEGAVFVGETLADGNGMFAIASGSAREGDLFCFTATRLGVQPVTSEFSENIEVPPTAPIERVNVSSAGAEANGFSLGNEAGSCMSDDGQLVVFESLATNIVNDDGNGARDVFVRNRMTGTTERISVSSSGGDSTYPGFTPYSTQGSMSADGRWVVFASTASNIVPGDVTNTNDADIYLRDRESQTTIAVTDPTEQDPPLPDGRTRHIGGREPVISADASTVAFVTIDDTYAPGDTNNNQEDVYVWTRSSGVFERVSISSTGGQIPSGFNAATAQPRLNSDGSIVAFQTFAALHTGANVSAVKVYVRDRTTGTTELISQTSAGVAVAGSQASLSADGRLVAFVTSAPLVAVDTNGKADVYLRDRQTGIAELCSHSPDGTLFLDHCATPSLSADGRFVAFVGPGSATRDGFTVLHPDIYIRDRLTGTTKEASIGVDGDSLGPSNTPVLSRDGRFLLFLSHGNNLVEGDTNNAADLFIRDRADELNPP